VIDAKADASPVTEADRKAEAAMRSLIQQTFPSHGVFGEEEGLTVGSGGGGGDDEAARPNYLWVLDPIDGTKSFITGATVPRARSRATRCIHGIWWAAASSLAPTDSTGARLLAELGIAFGVSRVGVWANSQQVCILTRLTALPGVLAVRGCRQAAVRHPGSAATQR